MPVTPSPMKKLFSRMPLYLLLDPMVLGAPLRGGSDFGDPWTRARRISTCSSVYNAFRVCRTNTDDAMYKCKPSTLRVRGNGGGSATGGLYSNLTLGLYIDSPCLCFCASSCAFCLPLSVKVEIKLSVNDGVCACRDAGSGRSREDMSPVEKNVGRVS